MIAGFAERVLLAVYEFQQRYGYAPTYAQMAQIMNLSPNSKSAFTHAYNVLEAAGYVKFDRYAKGNKRIARSMRITPQGQEVVEKSNV